MGLISRLKLASAVLLNSSDITTGIPIEQLLREWSACARTDAGVDVTPDNAIACATVFACVKVLAETQAMLPLPVYRRMANGGREQAREHPLWDLLNHRPNPWQTPQEFREMMMGFLVLRGNAYAYIVRNVLSDEVQSLIPIKPTAVRPKQQPDMTQLYDPSALN